jgi:MFS family permease
MSRVFALSGGVHEEGTSEPLKDSLETISENVNAGHNSSHKSSYATANALREDPDGQTFGRRETVEAYVGFVLALLGMLCAGTLYAFGAYVHSLRESMNFTQSQVETVGIIGDAGSLLCGPLSGVLVDRFGPAVSCAIAAFNLFVGYMLMWAMVHNQIENSVLLGAFFGMVGVGSTFMYLSLLTTQVKKFLPRYRGMVIGSLVSMYGLSALAFVTCYTTLFAGTSASTFLQFMGITTGTVAILNSGWAFMGHHLVSLLFTSNYQHLTEEDVEQTQLTVHTLPPSLSHGTIQGPIARTSEKQPKEVAAAERQTLELDGRSGRATNVPAAFKPLELMKDRNFVLSFVLFFLVAGAGLVFINNTTRYGKPLHRPHK